MGMLAILMAVVAIHVAPEGNDANDGSRGHPVRSAARALELVREAATDAEKMVLFANGTYFLEVPVVLDAEDRDIIFKAMRPRKAVLSGAAKVGGWRTDPRDARMLVADFPFEPRQEMLYTLTVNGRLADFSAYPQLGGQEKLRYLATSEDVPKDNHTVFEYDPLDLPDGGDYRDLDISSAYVFIPQEWASTTTYITTNDWKNNTFHLKTRTGMPIGKFNTGYQIMNTRFGLKSPGSWMFSVRDRRIIYWPREGETATNIVGFVSNSDSLFVLNGSRHIAFSGLVMEGCSAGFGAGPYKPGFIPALIGGSKPHSAVVENCELRNTAGCGVQFVKAEGCAVRRSHVHHTGAAGVSFFDGGSDNWVTDSEVDHAGLLKIGCHGIGCNSWAHIIRNKVHDIGGVGVSMWSQRSEFVSNELYRTMTAMRDGGGVYGAMVHCLFKDNYCHDNGDWPGLYNDEGGRDTLYVGNRFENSWWPFHMHDCYNITVVSNVFRNAGGMRYSFQGSVHCTFKDNLIQTELPIDRDPYVENTDVWDNIIQLKQANGTYGAATRLTLPKKPQAPMPPAEAVRVTTKPRIVAIADKEAGFGGYRMQGCVGVCRSREGYDVTGVPCANCRLGFDDENLYVHGSYEYNKVGPYVGCHNHGGAWGVHDGIRFHFRGFTVTVFFADKGSEKTMGGMRGEVVSSDPSLLFTTNNAMVNTGWWGRSTYAFILPLGKLGIDGRDAVGKSVPFNIEFYNGDHDEYKYYNQPGKDGILSATLAFRESAVDFTQLVDVKERFADGSCWFPGPIWPDGGLVQSAPATCERPGEGYKEPLHFDNHNAQLVGYMLSGATGLQGFPMLPFSAKKAPSGEGRYQMRMDDSSMKVSPNRFWVMTENWDLGTESTASANCAYLRFGYQRGGPFRVLLDAQDVAPAWWRKEHANAEAEVVAAGSSITNGIFVGFVTANVNGRTETLFAKMQFEPQPLAVRELEGNGRKGKRYVLEFLLLPHVGNVQVKAAISSVSTDEAAARFAADGESIDFDARNAACREAWMKFLAGKAVDDTGADQRKFYTDRYREHVKEVLK